CVQLSWDGGTTWTTAKTSANLTTTEASYILGGTADTWGRTWSDANFSNTNFRVRIIPIASNTSRDFSLDWAAVQVNYQAPAAALSDNLAAAAATYDGSDNLAAAAMYYDVAFPPASLSSGADLRQAEPLCPCSIWGASAVPGNPFAGDTTGAIELGVKFRSTVAGYISGVRFYKGSQDSGTHIGSLWTSTGTQLAQATFTNESASGWQQVSFNPPVAVQANTTYVASYHTNAGGYAMDRAFFRTSGIDSPPLSALASGVDGLNGVYSYSTASAFPTESFDDSNYWVDVVFDTSAVTTPTNTPTTTPTGGATSTPTSTPTTTPTALCPCSIWGASAVPTIPFASDTTGPIELGVKFRSASSGYISGVRFYKGDQNTGTHIGSLWSSSGALLAQATFESESASGWQQVSFSPPVAIEANTTYVASYHTSALGYAVTFDAFASSGVSSGSLSALAEGVDGSNGVYTYSAASAFPTGSYRSSNYWVDVVFDTSGGTTPTNTPTSTPTNTPTGVATNTPTSTPTNTPTGVATNTPTSTATNTPTGVSTNTPTSTATNTPTGVSTSTPTSTATNTPTGVSTSTP
ncbi:MAG: DUF4082 domain-containing protein, partial [Chloroflexales bacterium]|nr:DUF4082 domain-containing protein [Chloroflexales bacterium]